MGGGASMLQMKNAGSVVDALEAMVRASLIEVSDASRLTAFVQSAQKESDDDDEAGAPAAAVYKSQSGGIVDTIQDLLEKAEDQLADIRKTENKNKNNFGLLEQSLEDEIKFADFSKNLAQVTTDEEMAVAEYEKETKENELEKTTKSQDVKYKAKESKELDKYAAELKSDRSGVQDELDAVLEYLAKIERRCIAVAETYEDRAARREAEIAGLKQALDILESETALVQSSRKHRSFRGALQA